jgi:hypothetical protein
MIDIQFNQQQLQALGLYMRGLGEALPVVQAHAINDTASKAQTRLVDAVWAELMLGKRAIRSYTRLDKATPRKAMARILIKRVAMPLKVYKPRAGVRGVSVRVRRNEAREVHKHAFKIDRLGGNIFEREATYKANGKSNPREKPTYSELPIVKRFGPTVLGVIENSPGLLDKMLEHIDTELPANMQRHIGLLMDGKRPYTRFTGRTSRLALVRRSG